MKKGDEGYWAWRARTGATKKLKSPKHLWQLACKYFESCDESPYNKKDFIRGGESAGALVDLPTMIPYTWQGLDNYLNESGVLAKIEDYRTNKDGRYSEFAEVLHLIGSEIFDRKYTGGAVGAFPVALITRDLGMTEKTEQTVIAEQPLFPDK